MKVQNMCQVSKTGYGILIGAYAFEDIEMVKGSMQRDLVYVLEVGNLKSLKFN